MGLFLLCPYHNVMHPTCKYVIITKVRCIILYIVLGA
nr:MAG TPA: hypothetical protein [Caudoviricetes sp.]